MPRGRDLKKTALRPFKSSTKIAAECCWQIGFDNASRLTTAFDVPTGLSDDKTQTRSSGISIKQGVELKLGDRPVSHVAFRICDTQRCNIDSD